MRVIKKCITIKCAGAQTRAVPAKERSVNEGASRHACATGNFHYVSKPPHSPEVTPEATAQRSTDVTIPQEEADPMYNVTLRSVVEGLLQLLFE